MTDSSEISDEGIAENDDETSGEEEAEVDGNLEEQQDSLSSEEEELERSILRQRKRKITSQNYNPLRRVSLVSARFGVSEAATASICNAFNQDQGVSLEQNPELIISSSTLHDKRARVYRVEK